MTYRRERSHRSRKATALLAVILTAAIAVLAVVEVRFLSADQDSIQARLTGQASAESPAPTGGNTPPAAVTAEPEDTPEPTPTPLPEFEPHPVEETQPDKFILDTAVEVDGEIVDSYTAEREISFGLPEDYNAIEGVTTFRGDNFRTGASYGTAGLEAKQFGSYWTRSLGALTSYTGYTWTGSGWTGQPLIVKWDKETRAIMNMYDWAKEQDELVEVVHATMDGNVYFTELTTGKATRDNLYLGFTFKGAGSLDPRGYPILYVGAGYYGATSAPRALAVSLIDGTVLFEIGANEAFSIRKWDMFDAAPLVSAETDQLIWPGENGVVYIVDMNTDYDREAGTLTMDPQVVKWRYQSIRNANTGQYWLGMEGSPVAWQGYLFMGDNGGNLMCLDLSTLELVWVQDVLDDTNCTPVLELEDGHPYLYISTSFHYGWRSWTTADIPVWKIDAETGEIVWQVDYQCHTVSDLSGGVQGSIATGKNKLSDLIFVPVARTPNAGDGILAAISKSTGEVVWERHTQVYSWSTPVDIYDAEGNGYLIYCNSGGYMYLLDGLTGEIIDDMNLGSNTEASPAVYENTIVVGTRGQVEYGVTIN